MIVVAAVAALELAFETPAAALISAAASGAAEDVAWIP